MTSRQSLPVGLRRPLLVATRRSRCLTDTYGDETRLDILPRFRSSSRRRHVYTPHRWRPPASDALSLPPSSNNDHITTTNPNIRPFTTSARAQISLDDSEFLDEAEEVVDNSGRVARPTYGNVNKELHYMLRARKAAPSSITAVKELLPTRAAARQGPTPQKLGPQGFASPGLGPLCGAKAQIAAAKALAALEAEAKEAARALRKAQARDAAIKVRDLEQKFFMVPHLVRRFVSEYCTSKYKRLEGKVLGCRAKNESFDLEYTEIRSPRFQLLEADVARCDESVTGLLRQFRKSERLIHVAGLVPTLAKEWEDSYPQVVRECEEFVGIRLVAKRNVDAQLQSEELIYREYAKLRGRFDRVLGGLSSIYTILENIRVTGARSRDRRRRKLVESITAQRDMIGKARMHFVRAGHMFRGAHLLRRQYEGPFAAITHVRTLMHRGSPLTSVSPMEIMDSFIQMSQVGTDISEYPRSFDPTYAQNLRYFYIPRLLPRPSHPRSPELSIFWRQLDVTAPFEMALALTYLLRIEITYLAATLDHALHEPYGVWSKLRRHTLYRHNAKLRRIRLMIDAWSSDFRVTYEQFLRINWTRLRLETKLHNMGEWEMSRDGRVFNVSHPLHTDLARFDEWVDRMENKYWTATVVRHAQKLRVGYWQKAGMRLAIYERKRYEAFREQMLNMGSESVKPSSRKKCSSLGISAPTPEASSVGTSTVTTAMPVPGSDAQQGRRDAWATRGRKKSHMWRVSARLIRTYSTGPAARLPTEDDGSGIRSDPNHESGSLGGLEGSRVASSTCVITEDLTTATTPQAYPPPGPGSSGFWNHRLCKGPDGKDIVVHYCRSLQSTEEVARQFLDDKIVGFDMEWKAQASSTGGIRNNVSLIQVANRERVALFHIALFKPARDIPDFVAPSLQRLIESRDITKAGVAIKADCTRLRKFLGVEARGIFELSHLFKLVKYSQSCPGLINKRAVNLSDQVEEHFGLPLEKDDLVRCSDWSRPLSYHQVQYAATDPYACLRLYHIMDTKRRALDPAPPLPAHAELNLPICLVENVVMSDEPEADDQLLSDKVPPKDT